MSADKSPTEQARRLRDYFEADVTRERYAKLLYFAEKEVRFRSWSTADGSMPGGKTATDVLDDAIASILAEPGTKGRRRVPDDIEIGKAIMAIIRSKTNHAWESAENQTRIAASEDLEGNTTFDLVLPFERVFSADDRAAAQERYRPFMDYVRKWDKNVYAMLSLILNEGIDKPVKTIAKKIGIKESEVLAARKRLKTLIQQFQKLEAQK